MSEYQVGDKVECESSLLPLFDGSRHAHLFFQTTQLAVEAAETKIQALLASLKKVSRIARYPFPHQVESQH